MNNRAFTLSLIIAGIAMFMVYSYIDNKESQFVQEYGNPSPVVVAKADIKELELLDDRKVKVINVPQRFQAPGHFKKIEEVYNTIATVPIKAGEQITKPRVTYPGARSGLARQVSIGKRAVSIQVSDFQAVSKLVKPGDRVDLLATINYAGGQKDRLKVKTVLQDVLVLSTGLSVTNAIPIIGKRVDQEVRKMNLSTYTNFNTITLELSPFDAQKLTFIIGSGDPIHLTLRNNDDKTIERISATRLYDVLGEDAAEAKSYFADKERERNARRGR